MALVGLLAPLVAFAQDSTLPTQAQYDALYQRVLHDPSNVALNNQLIALAVQLKDYDAAIGAVERLIFYAPNDAGLQLEAAQLYLQIDSYAAARGYLDDALSLPSATPEQRTEATQLIAEVEQKTRPPEWSGVAEAGLRYQTNANVGSVLLGANEPHAFERPIADWNSFVLGTAGWTHAINANSAWEATFSGYYADQFKVNRLDLGFAETTFGPRFTVHDGLLSLKPYVIAQGFLLGSNPYQRALGAGGIAELDVNNLHSVVGQFEYKNRFYYNSNDYPLATDETGNLYTVSVTDNYNFTPNFLSATKFTFNQNLAAAAYNSYDQFMVNWSGRWTFDAHGHSGWVINPYLSAVRTNFRGVAPQEQPFPLTVRKDWQWNAGVNIEVPLLRDQHSLAIQVQYTHNDSNLERATYTNWLFLFGPEARF